MKPPAWLAELHRQWQAARGARHAESKRDFFRKWEDLLEKAGLKAAEEQVTAGIEAETLEKQGRIRLQRHRYRRYRIEKVVLPVASESWLVGLFGDATGQARLATAREHLQHWREQTHARFPESWETLCSRIEVGFKEGKSLRPFSWRAPEALTQLLAVLHGLTSHEWPVGTHVRNASEKLGWESKGLEQHRAAIEAGLSAMFGELTTLESLGIICTRSKVVIQGPLTLHFDDGTVYHTDSLQGETSLTHADLQRATRATTTATRILSVENSKSTFTNVCAANRHGNTLLIATSYPNAATLRLLELLPIDLPHHHFGDTDASGYAILRALRQQSPRAVIPFLMDWQDAAESRPLSEHDRRLLPSLLQDDLLLDCRQHLERMHAAGRKGRFEQERHGSPEMQGWPFYAEAVRVPVP